MAILMLFAGAYHFIKPKFYKKVVPSFLRGVFIWIYLSGAAEILFGAFLLFKETRLWGALGVLTLMLIFLPLHIQDVFSKSPFMGTKKAAQIRLILQFVLIAWAAFIAVE